MLYYYKMYNVLYIILFVDRDIQWKGYYTYQWRNKH